MRRRHPGLETADGGSADTGRHPDRTVDRHRLRHRVPSNRAVLGAVMVTIAAAGVFVAHRSASTPPTSRYVVLTNTVDAGSAVSSDDLGTVALDLPDGLGVVGAEQVDDVVGRIATVPLDELDLLRPDDLLEDGRFVEPGSVEIAIELGAARSLEGAIEAGSSVDVLATDPDGSGTSTVATAARVTEVRTPDGDGIGAGGTVLVRLALENRDIAERVADASVRSEITLALPAPSATTRNASDDAERPT